MVGNTLEYKVVLGTSNVLGFRLPHLPALQERLRESVIFCLSKLLVEPSSLKPPAAHNCLTCGEEAEGRFPLRFFSSR